MGFAGHRGRPTLARLAAVSHLRDSWRHSASAAPAVWGPLRGWVVVVPQSLLPESRNTAPPTPLARWQERTGHRIAATAGQQHAYPAADRASQEPRLAGHVHTGRGNPAGGALHTHCAGRGTGHSWQTDHA